MFTVFGLSHIIIFAIAFIIYMAIVLFVKKTPINLKNSLSDKILGVSLLAFFPIHTIFYIVSGSFHAGYDLPIFQICGVIFVNLGLYLIFKWAFCYKIAYFLGYGAMLISFLAPDLRQDFPGIYFMQFWISHVVILSIIVYVIKKKAFDIQIKWIDTVKVLAFLAVYNIFFTYPLNLWIRSFAGYSNYGYSYEIPRDNVLAKILDPVSPNYFIPTLALAFIVINVIFALKSILGPNLTNIGKSGIN